VGAIRVLPLLAALVVAPVLPASAAPAGPAAPEQRAPRLTLTGRVVDAASGAPLPGRTVSVIGNADPSVPQPVTTGPDGRYQVTGLMAGVRYQVRVEGDDDGPHLATYAPGVVGEVDGAWITAPARVDVAVQRGYLIRGRYRAPRIDPELLFVNVSNLDRSDVGYGATRVEVAEDGTWRAWVPPGRYGVWFGVAEQGGAFWYGGAAHPVVEDLAAAAVLRVGPGRSTPSVDVVEPPQALIRVRVVDAATRRPVTAPCVEQAHDAPPTGPGSRPSGGLTWFSDVDCPKGAAPETTSVKGGRDVVEVSGGPGYLPARLTVRVQRGHVRDYTVALRRAAQVRGRAVDAATGRPVRYPCATPYPRGPWPLVRASARTLCQDRPNGWFDVPSVRPGLVTVGISGEDHHERFAKDADTHDRATTYRVVAGRTLDIGTVRLRRSGTVRGRVLDAAGLPVAGAVVALPEAGWWPEHGQSATTDAGGRYTLGGVPGGQVRLRIRPPAGSPWPDQWLGGVDERHATVVRSRWGATVTAPVARLALGGTLRVRVTGASGAVFAEVFDAAGRPVDQRGKSARVGRDGAAVVDPLPATGVRVHVWSGSLLDPAQAWFGGGQFADADTVVVRRGRTTTITVALGSGRAVVPLPLQRLTAP